MRCPLSAFKLGCPVPSTMAKRSSSASSSDESSSREEAMMSPSKRDRRSELDATRFGSQRPTAQWEWLMAAERDALSPGPGSPVLKPRNDGGSSARYNRMLVKVPRKAGRLGIGLNDANQVTTLVSANGLQVQDRCGATTTHSIAHLYGPFGVTLCPCLEHVLQCL